MTLVVPDVFNYFALQCHGDDDEAGIVIEDLVRHSLSILKKDQREELDGFLGAVLAGPYTDEALYDLWWHCGAGFVFFSGGPVRDLFVDIRKLIAEMQ